MRGQQQQQQFSRLFNSFRHYITNESSTLTGSSLLCRNSLNGGTYHPSSTGSGGQLVSVICMLLSVTKPHGILMNLFWHCSGASSCPARQHQHVSSSGADLTYCRQPGGLTAAALQLHGMAQLRSGCYPQQQWMLQLPRPAELLYRCVCGSDTCLALWLANA